MPTTSGDPTARDAERILSVLRQYAQAAPVPVTDSMMRSVGLVTGHWMPDRFSFAYRWLEHDGYLFGMESSTVLGTQQISTWFDPLGKKGVRTAPHPAPKPTRPSWDETGMALAGVFAARSADAKFKVGCAILSNTSHSVVSLGVNGRYPGCPTEERASLETGCSEALHAEQNAIVRARWEHGEKHTLYTSMEPCHECALLILAARHINRVVYGTPYAGDGRRRRGADILREAGVEVARWQS